MNNKAALRFSVPIAALFAFGGTAAAQTSPGAQLDEIIVTARKQSESILKVPVAASTVSASDLARTGITDFSSLSGQMPSVNFDATSGTGGSLTIRGIGSSVVDPGIEQTVVTVIDGVQTSRGVFTNLGLLDLAQVEVLKGPQALFFGKNSPGGALSLSSQGPTDTLKAYFKGGYEFNASEKVFEGAVSGPITSTIRARVAARYSDIGGWLQNVGVTTADPFAGIPGYAATVSPASQKYNNSRNAVGRIALDYKPTSAFTATLRLLGSTLRDNGPDSNSEVVNCGGASHPDIFGVPDPAGDCTANGRVTVAATPSQFAASSPAFKANPYGNLKTYLTSLTMDYSTGPVTVTSVTGYMGYHWNRLFTNPTIYGFPFSVLQDKFTQFSQELRVVTKYDAPINFSGGIYYESSSSSDNSPTALFALPADPTTGKFETFDYAARASAKSYSAFGQVRWKIVEQLELDGGVRYSHDTRNNELFNSFVNANTIGTLPLLPVGDVLQASKSFNNFSPEITSSWTPVRDTLIYGSFRTGFKAGASASPGLLTEGITQLFYEPEKIKGFEIGAKTLQLNGRLRLSAAAYTYKYDNLQIANFDSAKFVVQPLGGDLRTKGFEASGVFKASRELTLNAGLGYAHSRYTRFPGVACYSGQTEATGCIGGAQDLTGQQRFRSPDWTGEAGFVYETPVSSALVFGVDGGMNFSSSYFSQENNSPYAHQHGYQLYNAGIHLKSADGRWDISLIGRNLSNKRLVTSSLDLSDAGSPGSIAANISRPRQLLLQGTVRY